MSHHLAVPMRLLLCSFTKTSNIKPGNFLLFQCDGNENDEHVRLALTDFGFTVRCKVNSKDVFHGHCGTPGYIAPDQW